jgi:hypothetical protein
MQIEFKDIILRGFGLGFLVSGYKVMMDVHM